MTTDHVFNRFRLTSVRIFNSESHEPEFRSPFDLRSNSLDDLLVTVSIIFNFNLGQHHYYFTENDGRLIVTDSEWEEIFYAFELIRICDLAGMQRPLTWEDLPSSAVCLDEGDYELTGYSGCKSILRA
jgi:hypothetical protein